MFLDKDFHRGFTLPVTFSAEDVFRDICRVLENKEKEIPKNWRLAHYTRLYYYSSNKKYPYLLLLLTQLSKWKPLPKYVPNSILKNMEN